MRLVVRLFGKAFSGLSNPDFTLSSIIGPVFSRQHCRTKFGNEETSSMRKELPVRQGLCPKHPIGCQVRRIDVIGLIGLLMDQRLLGEEQSERCKSDNGRSVKMGAAGVLFHQLEIFVPI
ncbi:hypothetical protein M513_09102, partial [Trichuris suis]